jgi:uncharacterized membrane protein YoaK (UPF0700 family)
MTSMKPTLPTLLSLNAGFVDTAGFLALHGLFTSHVTGNFVTFAASMVLGTTGAVGKLLALPVFCVFVFLTRLLGDGLRRSERSALAPALAVKLVLLLAAAGMAAYFGPFPDGDTLPALATGMSLVAAMAIQNAVHRVHLSDAPPSTVMTMTTTQIMIDIADIFSGAADATTAARARLSRMSVSVAAFVVGCAMAAALYAFYGMWCFLAPPVLALWALLASAPKGAAKA